MRAARRCQVWPGRVAVRPGAGGIHELHEWGTSESGTVGGRFGERPAWTFLRLGQAVDTKTKG